MYYRKSSHIIKAQIIRQYILTVFIAALLTSCTESRITNPAIPDHISKLRSTNTKSLILETGSENEFKTIGHQYLLVFIPFGKIVISEPEKSIYNKAYTRLAIKGYNIDQANGSKKNKILLTLKNLQLSAYDLLFIRNIYCEAEVEVMITDPYNRVQFTDRIKAKKSAYKALAFSYQLQHIYEQCLDEAVNQALNSL